MKVLVLGCGAVGTVSALKLAQEPSCEQLVVADAVPGRAQQLADRIDPELKWNEARQSYDFGAIDWPEFWRVVGGHGPCNRERLAARVKAWDDGAWVRDAALAHASKRAAKREQAA